MIEEGEKNTVFITDFNTFTYDHSLNCGRKHFCDYCLHAFIKEKNLKCHTRDCFKNNGKQGSMPVSAETFGTTKQVN